MAIMSLIAPATKLIGKFIEDKDQKNKLAYEYYKRFDNMFTGPGKVKAGWIDPLPRKQSLEELKENLLICTLNEMIDNMINEELLNEMRVRELKEKSNVVIKEDFYSFINAGQNVLRTLEENGLNHINGKKYLEYLVRHNIM